jgi:hypothetical protein
MLKGHPAVLSQTKLNMLNDYVKWNRKNKDVVFD